MASRLVTEADVRAGRIADPFVVDRDTIVTPSALDLLFARGVRVRFERDGRTPGAAPGAGSPTPRPTLATDPAAPSCACSQAQRAPATAAPAVPVSAAPAAPPSAAPAATPSAASAATRVAADWVEVFRRGRPRRFDPAPFRAEASGTAASAIGRGSGGEVVASAVGSGSTRALIDAIERLGHRVVAFSRRDGRDGGGHVLARVALGPTGAVEAAIAALEAVETGFEIRIHRWV